MRVVHGYAHKEPLYDVWKNMKKRCYQNIKHWERYKEKNIQVCDEWRNDYMAFRKWALDNGYQKGLSIDRINNAGNYEPSNCRFTTTKVQANNTDTNVYITYKGKTHTLKEWSEILCMSYVALVHRHQRGWNTTRMLEQPVAIRRG